MQKTKRGIAAFIIMLMGVALACVLAMPATESHAFNYYQPSIAPEIPVKLQKVDDSGNPVAGAKLTITEFNAEYGSESGVYWSGDNTEDNKKTGVSDEDGYFPLLTFAPGTWGTVKLEETFVPEGYEVADPITIGLHTYLEPPDHLNFEEAYGWLEVNGEVIEGSKAGERPVIGSYELAYNPSNAYTIKVEDKKKTPVSYDVQVSKLDEDGNFLAGAELEIFSVADDGTATSVQTLTSGSGALTVQLAEGKYRLVENSAPEGYEKAEPVEFTVSKDMASPIEVKMTDKKKPDEPTDEPTDDPTDEPSDEPSDEPADKPTPTNDNEGDDPNSTTTPTTGSNTTQKEEPNVLPETGDVLFEGLAALAALGAALLTTTAFLKKRLLG